MKYVLVTGAGGGMGKSAVKLLSDAGYKVFALDLRGVDGANGVVPIKADITSHESLGRAVELVRKYTDELYAIVHFAGIYMLDSLVEISDDSFRKIFDVNLRGAYLINKTFLPFLRNGSRILITTSELAPLDPLPFTGIYSVSKSALDRYAYSLRMELQLLGISVSVLRAGAVNTDMLGVSTDALDRFCEGTKLYSCNSERFRKIVNGVEAKNIKADKLAEKCVAILKNRRPRFAYSINRNPLLLLLNVLPSKLQFFIIRKILS